MFYWSDTGPGAKIEASGLDGNHRSSLVTTQIQHPIGLTLDGIMDRLYWVDFDDTPSVHSVRLDGSDRKVRNDDS